MNINLPFDNKQIFIDSFKKSITKNTKVIFLSHITSSTALIFPVKEIIQIAKNNNILTIIDGAHAPAQVKLSLSELNPDIYVGACHKWMCSPKGVSFLYASDYIKDSIDPIIISWGYKDQMFNEKSKFINNHQWQGTNDLSAYFTIPEVINFLTTQKWDKISQECHNLIVQTKDRFDNINSSCEPTSRNNDHLGQMLSFKLNQSSEFLDLIKQDPSKIVQLQKTIFSKTNIHIPIIWWNNFAYMRISIQAYNSQSDVDKMFDMLDYFNLL